MSLEGWAKNGWLRPHQTNRQQVTDLLAIVVRDLADARSSVSSDWQFGIAYNAALKLCTILLYASGYRPEKNLAHYRTLQALPLILGSSRNDDADYLDACRAKRNTAEYDVAGCVTESEAEELRAFAESLRDDVCSWLAEHHPNLLKN
ncbi:hypothetical protein [Prosthecobacter sp.]|uniref:hypothetical protein n=1 Tax=Prosthecobacter sp. TaxID=1965333 RepID=UPI0037831589